MVSKQQFLTGTIWKLIETLFSVGTTFLISLILARLLLPKDFGIIAITSIVINFSEIVLQSAFTTPLIQKEVVDKKDYASVLSISLCIAVLLYVIFYIIAPYISDYYKEAQLKNVIRVICLVFYIQAFGSVLTAMIHRKMNFKLVSIANFLATIISGCIGVGMAYLDFGIWALVSQKLIQQFILTLILMVKLKWQFSFTIDFNRIRVFWSFGFKILSSSVLSFLGDSITSAVTGKVYSMRDLGYSSKGFQYPCELSIYSFQALLTTLLPTFSTYQNDIHLIKLAMRKVVAVSSYLLFPMMAGLFVVADPLTRFLLTEKWLLSVPYMKIACIYYSATPLMLINIQVFHSLGKGEIRLITETIRTILIILLLIIGVGIFSFDLYKIFIYKSIIEIFILVLTIGCLKKVISYGIWEYFSNVFLPMLLSVTMAIFVSWIKIIVSDNNTSLLLLLQILTGVTTYFILSIVFKPEGFIELSKLVKLKGLKPINKSGSI